MQQNNQTHQPTWHGRRDHRSPKVGGGADKLTAEARPAAGSSMYVYMHVFLQQLKATLFGRAGVGSATE